MRKNFNLSFKKLKQIFNKKILLAIFFLCSIFTIKAQQAILSGGASFTSSNGSLSYSIGNFAYSFVSGTNGSLIIGPQVPYEIYVVTAINSNEINVDCNIYPNPVSDKLILKIDNSINSSLSYSIYNSDGKILKTEKIIEALTEIKFEKYSKGIYFIEIKTKDQSIKTFKIVKH